MCRAIETAGPLLSHNLFNVTNAKNVPNVYQRQEMVSQDDKLKFRVQTVPSLNTPTPYNPAPDQCDIDIGNFDDFPGLDLTSISENKEEVEDEQDDMFNFDADFDNTELSILYSFLLDEHGQPIQFKKPTPASEAGVLSVNLLDTSPFDAMFQSMDETIEPPLAVNPPIVQYDTRPTNVPLQAPVMQIDVPPNLVIKKDRRLCKMDGCQKRSRSHGLCIAHGGGRRCAVENCNKSSQAGEFCIRHGGGKRCTFEGCEKAAQSNNLCKSHGGGPRCSVEGCEKSSQGGGFCRFHGGGKRCGYAGCEKGTQRGDFCALHGGSRLCKVEGCLRNDRGGGLCASHGGGKRCAVPGCERPCRRQGRCSAHCRVDVLTE